MEYDIQKDDREGDDYLGSASDGSLYGQRDQNDPAAPDFQPDDRGESLPGLIEKLLRGLPKELHSYKPLLISSVRKIVPECYTISGASDAVRFLHEAHENWQRKKEQYNSHQFSAYAKRCVHGKLQNQYVRSRRSSSVPDEACEQTRRECAILEERQNQLILVNYQRILNCRPELLHRLHKNSHRKDFRRHLACIRRSTSLLPDIEQYVIIQRAKGNKGKNLAEQLSISPGRITQIEQKGYERALEYMADLFDGVSRESLAHRTAEMEVTSDARAIFLTSEERERLVKIRMSHVLRTRFIHWNPQIQRLERISSDFVWSWQGYQSKAFPDIFTCKPTKYRPARENEAEFEDADTDSYDDLQAEQWERNEIINTYYSNPPV